MSTQDDSLSIAEPEDFFVQRDGDDELQPITQPLPGVDQQIRVIPMSMGDLNQYGSAEGRLNPGDLSDEEIAEILSNHWYDVRERDDYEVTAEMVAEDMIGFGRDALLTAILRASGYDMQNALNLENLEMLEQVPEGKLETMMELAEQKR
ncbi:hypothetical protein AArcSl_1280 [Halalkaliarchaeum desulfuricum]|uniref:Uncharacterized protein n=1 Tax=Halalkaliarchaeum desulfuricum TaxID=2055893 RepID=A0A343TII9_9EURY|nr:hypothetical protein [Halalkaliarchaeum desulfuricum]AUX08911.1 hypothetical protein AArcSl_1280 [Halalkaliarchaeum desulfuricum]